MSGRDNVEAEALAEIVFVVLVEIGVFRPSFFDLLRKLVFDLAESFREFGLSRAKRVLIGKLDPDSGQIIPTDGRNKGARSKPKQLSPEIDMQKRIQELEDENRQLILQINALKKELARINSKSSQR